MAQENMNYTVVDGCLTVYLNGKSIDLERENNSLLYDEAIQSIRDNDFENLKDIVTNRLDSAKEVASFSDENFEVRNGNLYLKGEYTPIPEHIAYRVKEFMDMKLPYMPLVNFWLKVRENPSPISYEGLLRFLEHNRYPLTADGCFIGYKKVSKILLSENVTPVEGVSVHEINGKKYQFVDSYSRTFDNGPGASPRIDRFAVDPDPSVTCSHGLHVAAWQYANDFSGTCVMSVKVDPKDVVAVPYDYNNQKIRTCGYTVLEECAVQISDPLVKFPEHGDRDNYYRDNINERLVEIEAEIRNFARDLDDGSLSEEEIGYIEDDITDLENERDELLRELRDLDEVDDEVELDEEESEEAEQELSKRETLGEALDSYRDQW